MKKIIWILLDNRIGSVNQARGVEYFLDKDKFEIVEKQLEYNCLAALPNFIRGKTLLGIKADSRQQLKGQLPDIVLSSSRRTVPVARYLRKISKNKTKIVQLMHPGNAGMKEFSLIFVPEHDKGKKCGTNVEYIVGCAHKITDESLSQAHKKWSKKFAKLPKPLTAVIVGGAIKKHKFSPENAAKLGELVYDFYENHQGTLLITTSRRTGIESEKMLMQKLAGARTYEYLWGSQGENPYMGFLSEAENIIVTGDSVSMCSEAVGTGKNVYIFTGQKWLTNKHMRFVESLYQRKIAMPLGQKNSVRFKKVRMLNPAEKIAKKISKI